MNRRIVGALCLTCATLGTVATTSTTAMGQALPDPNSFANWADLKCYTPDTQQDLTTVLPPITVTQLNPLFQSPNPVVPDHQVQLGKLLEICVPVEKNGVPPTADALPFEGYFDLACYQATVTSSPAPTLPPLNLMHRNPVLVGGVSGVPALLPQRYWQEPEKIASPSQICVPIAKTESGTTLGPPPPAVLSLVEYLDFECWTMQPHITPPLALGLTQLNPLLVQEGLPAEQVTLGHATAFCGPIAKNGNTPPSTVLPIVQNVDLKKYLITSTPSGAEPVNFTLNQIDPIFTSISPVQVNTLTPIKLALPVAKSSPRVCIVGGTVTITGAGYSTPTPVTVSETFVEPPTFVTSTPAPFSQIISLSPAPFGGIVIPHGPPLVMTGLNEGPPILSAVGDNGTATMNYGSCGNLTDSFSVTSTNPYTLNHTISGSLNLSTLPSGTLTRSVTTTFTASGGSGTVSISAGGPALCSGSLSFSFNSAHPTVALPITYSSQLVFDTEDELGDLMGTETLVVPSPAPVPLLTPWTMASLALALLALGAAATTLRRRTHDRAAA